MIKIEIDRDACIGYAACLDAAPRSLRLGADGKAEAIAEVADDDAAYEAEAICPMAAISLREVEQAAA